MIFNMVGMKNAAPTSLCLYELGNTHNEITGGWSVGPQSGTGSFTLRAQDMQIYLSGTAWRYVPTVRSIDLTNYSTIHVRGSASIAGPYIRLYIASTRNVTGNNSAALKLVACSPANTVCEGELDVSAFVGNYYVYVGAYREGTACYWYIQKIWMT